MTAHTHGFTLVEVLVATVTLVIFFSAISIIMNLSLQAVGRSEVLSQATLLAEERIEAMRSANYLDVGVVGGIPHGVFPAEETVDILGTTFTITTSVIYVDDPYDEVAPKDTDPEDYKKVDVSVDWDGVYHQSNPMVFSTIISARVNQSSSNTGTLAVRAINAYGEPIAGAEFHITATSLVPAVDLTGHTDSQGWLIIPGSPICDACYEAEVTKAGYTRDRTYGRDEIANPTKPDLSVLEGEVTESVFVIDKVSTLTLKAVRTKAYNFSGFQGVEMRLRGSKVIGRTDTDAPVYKYDQSVVTGFGGSITLPDMEWDTYFVSLPSGSSVDMAASWPLSPFSLQPASSGSFTMVVTGSSAHNLLLSALDNTNAPVASASVELVNPTTSYIATKSTGIISDPDRSQVFFPSLPATDEPYEVHIFSDGYESITTEATISGKVIQRYILNPE